MWSARTIKGRMWGGTWAISFSIDASPHDMEQALPENIREEVNGFCYQEEKKVGRKKELVITKAYVKDGLGFWYEQQH